MTLVLQPHFSSFASPLGRGRQQAGEGEIAGGENGPSPHPLPEGEGKSAAVELVQKALQEDRAISDVTSRALFTSRDIASGYVVFKGNSAILYGLALAQETFKTMAPRARLRLLCREGAKIRRGAKVMKIQGPAAALLAAERTALNFLCHLSGIATQTALFVAEARRCRASFEISDTRKTHAGLRLVEKAAVAIGGGVPHRANLASLAMIKDNHLRIFQRTHGPRRRNFLLAKSRLLKSRGLKVEIEVQSLRDLDLVLAAQPHWIMLDNMGPAALRQAVRRIRAARPAVKIEVSGGVRIGDIRRLAPLGINRISCGAIIHSAPFADFSLELF